MLGRLPALIDADPALVRRGRFFSGAFLVGVGPTDWLVTVERGRVARVERGPFLLRSWSFALRASEDAWRRFWEPVPAAGWHDLFAMKKAGHMRIEGDLGPLMTHLRWVKDVLELPRATEPRPSARGPRRP